MSWLDKNQLKIFSIMWAVIIFLTVFFSCSFTGKCASSVNTTLPYSCAEFWDYNTALHDNFDVALSWARARYENIDHVPEGYSILVWTTDGIYTDWAGRKGTQYTFMVNPYTSYNYSENMDYSSNTVNLATVYPIYNFYYIDAGTYSSNNGGYSAVLLGNSASVDTEFGVYLPRYPFYYDGEPILDSDGTEIIVSRVEGSVIVTGHATAPDLSGNDISSDKPDIDDYLPSLPSQPSFDNTNLESMVESIYNWLKWEYNAIKGTLEGLVNFLSDTINYGIQKIIDNIKSSIQNFYDNMLSLFEPLLNSFSEVLTAISDKINYITEPIDSEEIQESFESTSVYGVYDDFSTFFSSFDSVINNTSEPDSLIIPIHFENISLLAQFGVGCQYLDLVQFKEIRSPLRAFCWVFCSFGVVMLVAHSLPDWLKGSSGGGSSSLSGKEN